MHGGGSDGDGEGVQTTATNPVVTVDGAAEASADDPSEPVATVDD